MRGCSSASWARRPAEASRTRRTRFGLRNGPGGILGDMDQATTVIAVTDAAAGKIRQLAAKEGRAEPILRVRVVAGGARSANAPWPPSG